MAPQARGEDQRTRVVVRDDQNQPTERVDGVGEDERVLEGDGGGG